MDFFYNRFEITVNSANQVPGRYLYALVIHNISLRWGSPVHSVVSRTRLCLRRVSVFFHYLFPTHDSFQYQNVPTFQYSEISCCRLNDTSSRNFCCPYLTQIQSKPLQNGKKIYIYSSILKIFANIYIFSRS